MSISDISVIEIDQLLDAHWHWLRDKTTVMEIGQWIEITTPYLDRHNDAIQLYVRRDDGGYLISDDGSTIADLASSGVNLETPKRRALLDIAIQGFGVSLDCDRLEVLATEETFPLKKQSLIQAVLAVGDLFYLSEPSVASLFVEDVQAWLDEQNIRYIPNIPFVGKSGYSHHFNFAIPKSKNAPERILRALAKPDKQSAGLLIFDWLDVRDSRQGTKAYALLSDVERGVPAGVIDALRSYEIQPIAWSQKDSVRQELVA